MAKIATRAAAVAVALNLFAATAFAWDDCTPPPPPPPPCCEHHHKTPKPTPESTPVPTLAVPTPAPTAVPTAQSTPAAAVATSAVAAPVVPSGPQGAPQTNLSEYCHYEPTTGLWSIRHTTDLTRTLSLADNEAIVAEHICDQHVVEIASAPVPVAAVTVVAIAPPPAVVVVETALVTDELTELSAPSEDQPEEEAVPPAPRVPTGFPNLGDGSTADQGD